MAQGTEQRALAREDRARIRRIVEHVLAVRDQREEMSLAQAEPLYRRSLAIWKKALGPEHPNVAMSLENISELYRKIEKTDEAKQLAEPAAMIRALKR